MKPKVENKLKIIEKAANENRIFIGDIYHEIFTAIRDLRKTVDDDSRKETIEEWKDVCEEAVHESKVLSDHIDYFFFVPLDPKDFENAAPSSSTFCLFPSPRLSSSSLSPPPACAAGNIVNVEVKNVLTCSSSDDFITNHSWHRVYRSKS
jgi:hypothetical protein